MFTQKTLCACVVVLKEFQRFDWVLTGDFPAVRNSTVTRPVISFG